MVNHDAQSASKRSIDLLTKRFGKNTGRIITVDSDGRFGVVHNTGFMPVALASNKDHKIYTSLEGNSTSTNSLMWL